MRTILITGASGGSSPRKLVKTLAQMINSFLFGRNKDKLSQLYGNYTQAELVEIDITDEQALEGLVADLYLRYGKIDVLINNAGYGIFEDFDKISNQDIHQMFGSQYFCFDESVSFGCFSYEGDSKRSYHQYR